jgi:WD40 repeat protein
LDTGACLRVLEGHNGSVNCVSLAGDGRLAVSGSGDKTVRLWDLETGACRGIYVASAVVSAARFAADGRVVCGGTATGEVCFLDFPGIEPGTPILTATRLWLFDNHSWDVNLTAQCAHCGKRFVVRDEWIGQQIECPMDGCGKTLKLNPFVCDFRDRRIF